MLTPEEEARAVYAAYEIWQAIKKGFTGKVTVLGSQEFLAAVEKHLRPLLEDTEVGAVGMDLELARELAAVEQPELN